MLRLRWFEYQWVWLCSLDGVQSFDIWFNWEVDDLRMGELFLIIKIHSTFYKQILTLLRAFKPSWYIEWIGACIWVAKWLYNEGDGHSTIDKFDGNNFNLSQFKLEMLMSTQDLSKIVENLELPLPSTTATRLRRRMSGECKKASAIISTSLVDKAYIKGYNRPIEVWKSLCNIHVTKTCPTFTWPKTCPTFCS